MRREVALKGLRFALVLVLGMAVDRFVLPIFEPLTRTDVLIFPDGDKKECTYGWFEEVHYLGKLKTAFGFPPTRGVVTMGTYTEGYFDLPCRTNKNIGDVILGCSCR